MKRVIAVFLVLTMCIGILPMSVLADEEIVEVPAEAVQELEPDAEEIVEVPTEAAQELESDTEKYLSEENSSEAVPVEDSVSISDDCETSVTTPEAASGQDSYPEQVFDVEEAYAYYLTLDAEQAELYLTGLTEEERFMLLNYIDAMNEIALAEAEAAAELAATEMEVTEEIAQAEDKITAELVITETELQAQSEQSESEDKEDKEITENDETENKTADFSNQEEVLHFEKEYLLSAPSIEADEEPAMDFDLRLISISVDKKEVNYGELVTYTLVVEGSEIAVARLNRQCSGGISYDVEINGSGTYYVSAYVNNRWDNGINFIDYISFRRVNDYSVGRSYSNSDPTTFYYSLPNTVIDLSSTEVTVRGTAPQVDIVIDSITVDKPTATFGDTITYTFSLTGSAYGRMQIDFSNNVIESINYNGSGQYSLTQKITSGSFSQGKLVINEIFFSDEYGNDLVVFNTENENKSEWNSIIKDLASGDVVITGELPVIEIELESISVNKTAASIDESYIYTFTFKNCSAGTIEFSTGTSYGGVDWKFNVEESVSIYEEESSYYGNGYCSIWEVVFTDEDGNKKTLASKYPYNTVNESLLEPSEIYLYSNESCDEFIFQENKKVYHNGIDINLSEGEIVDADDYSVGELFSVVTYNKNSADPYEVYPIGMKYYTVYTDGENKHFDVINTFTDIFQYLGTSIRIIGNHGMKVEYGIPQNSFQVMKNNSSYFYSIAEIGTVATWAETNICPVLGCKGCMSAYSYNAEKSYSEYEMKLCDDYWQYSNAFTFTDFERTKPDLAIRPYMILNTPDGDTITLYGGVVIRSIGYVALQNENAYETGTDAYDFIWDIIEYVYPEKERETDDTDDSYPEKNITAICPWGKGGGSDNCFRAFCTSLQNELDVTINVNNQTGAGGVIGHEAIADAEPDGYTIGMISWELSIYAPLKMSEYIYENYIPICRINADAAAVTVCTSWANAHNITNLDSFIQYCKAHPGEVRMGGSTSGSAWHVAGGHLMNTTGIDVQMVTYSNGGAEAVIAAAQGEIEGLTVSVGEVRAYVESGDLMILGIMDHARNSEFPDVPTCAEQGYDCYYTTHRGLAVPCGTDEDIVEKLEKACAAAAEDADFVSSMASLEQRIAYLNRVDYTAYLEQSAVDVAAAMKTIGLLTNDTPKSPTVYLITKNISDPYWVSVDEGVLAAVEEAKMNGFDISYKWVAPTNGDSDTAQIECINNAYADNADVILLASNGPDTEVAVIEQYSSDGVKFIFVDSPANSKVDLQTLATDNVNAGEIAGRTLLEALTKAGVIKAKIGIINGKATTLSTQREEGFRKAFADTEFEILESVYTDEDLVSPQEAASRFITDGCIALLGTDEDTSIGVGNAIKAESTECNVLGIGFEKSDAIIKLVTDGNLVATVSQNPYNMGYYGMQSAIEYLKNGTTQFEDVDTGVTVLTADYIRENMVEAESDVTLIYAIDCALEDDIRGYVASKYKETVEELSGGSITIDIYPNSIMGSENDVLEAMVTESVDVDIASISASSLTSYGCSMPNLLNLPYTFTSRDHFYDFASSDIAEILGNEPQTIGLPLHGILYGEQGFRHTFTKLQEVNSMEDLKETKIRVPNVPISVGWAEGVGASAVCLAFSELYSALQLDVVESLENTLKKYYEGLFYEVTEYVILDGHMFDIFEIVISDNAWNELSENQKSIMQQAAEITMEYNKQLSQNEETRMLSSLEDKGIKIIHVDDTGKKTLRSSCSTIINQYNQGNLLNIYNQIVNLAA